MKLTNGPNAKHDPSKIYCGGSLPNNNYIFCFCLNKCYRKNFFFYTAKLVLVVEAKPTRLALSDNNDETHLIATDLAGGVAASLKNNFFKI